MSRIGIGVSVRKIGASPPLIIKDGNGVGWYLSDDLSTITKDAGDFISEWRDKLGSGHDLLQAVGASQPKWFLNDGVKFDSIDDFMKSSFTFSQPEQIYIVFKNISVTNSLKIFDGSSFFTGYMTQYTVVDEFRIHAGGAVSPPQGSLAVGVYGIARVLFDGANSSLQINKGAKSIGDVGSASMGGFTLGANGLNQQWSNIQVKETILRKVADTTQDEQVIYNYLAKKYSI